MILYVKKRAGELVLFHPEKINSAIIKAFVAVHSSVDHNIVKSLTEQIVQTLNSQYTDESHPTVEDIQNQVENTLLSNSHIEVAKAYILYREKHKQIRESQKLHQIQDHKLIVTDPSGKKIPFDSKWIKAKLKQLSSGLTKISTDEIISDVCQQIYNNMPSSEIELLVLNTTKQRIEYHYDYSYLASRLVLDKMYQNVMGASSTFQSKQLNETYCKKFKDYIHKGIELDLLHPELNNFDLKKLGAAITPERDHLFLYLGMQTIEDRYLLREREGKQDVFELPQWMWMRVAMGVAIKEKNREERAIQFYHYLSQMLVVCSTPTLFNSGTTHSQMSSCYLNTVDDSMTGIFKSYADEAQLSKWAGGIGTCWTAVRAKNAVIKGTNGRSQGIIPFIKIYNDVSLAVNQGGKRKGAMAAYLDIWHLDIEEFLELKKNTGDERRRAHDIHTAVFLCDLFMKRVQANEKWTLFSPDTAPELLNCYGKQFEKSYLEYETQNIPGAKTIDAFDLWRKILTMLYETGHPWITFRDAINVRSPQSHVGIIRNSNLCTEITLNTSEDETAVCNLASINLSKMIKNKEIDESLLRETVGIAIRILDNVIDNNFYPIVEAKQSNLKHRPVGLGVMGYQDALYQMQISFDSEDNVQFADTSMELISHAAIFASSQLAKERGSYHSFNGSQWDRGFLPIDTIELLEQERGQSIQVSRNSTLDWQPVRDSIRKYGMRNSNCMAIAPTATISNIAGTFPCVEPAFKNIYMKENLSGNFTVVNRYLVDDLAKLGLWTPEILTKIKINNGSILDIEEIPIEIRRRFKVAFEIDPHWIIETTARRTKWIDQSASTNIFIKTTSGKMLSDIYMKAWQMGLKTTYYLRTLAASQITKMSTNTNFEKNTPESTTTELKTCNINDPDCEACQ